MHIASSYVEILVLMFVAINCVVNVLRYVKDRNKDG